MSPSHKRNFETAPPKNVYGITFLPGRRVYTRENRNGSDIVIVRSVCPASIYMFVPQKLSCPGNFVFGSQKGRWNGEGGKLPFEKVRVRVYASKC